MNIAMETSARRRGGLLAVSLAMLIVVGALVPMWARGDRAESAASTFAVYLEPASVPDADRLSLADAEVGDVLDGRAFRIVATIEEFEAQVAATQTASVWVHADALDDVPTALLREAMNRGAVIVGIDMPSGMLTSKLNVSGSSTPDWHPEGVVTFVLYAEAQSTSSGMRTLGNERFDPEHPVGLLHLVSQTATRIGEMQN